MKGESVGVLIERTGPLGLGPRCVVGARLVEGPPDAIEGFSRGLAAGRGNFGDMSFRFDEDLRSAAGNAEGVPDWAATRPEVLKSPFRQSLDAETAQSCPVAILSKLIRRERGAPGNGLAGCDRARALQGGVEQCRSSRYGDLQPALTASGSKSGGVHSCASANFRFGSERLGP